MLIDQFNDVGFRMLNQCISEFPEAEDFVKEAMLDPDENEKRAQSAFAWPEERLFPIDSPHMAALSRIYIEKQASAVPKRVVETCQKALDLFGVDLPLRRKEAAVEPRNFNYLLPHLKRFSVFSQEDVKLASEAILRNNRKLSFTDKIMASVKLTKLSADHNVELPKKILKLAGTTMCSTPQLRDWIEVRAMVTSDPDISVGFSKLAEAVNEMPALVSDRDELTKLAVTLHEMDEAAGLTKLYDTKLLNPVETVFNTEKIADDMIEVAGRMVPLETLLSIPVNVYRDIFGDDLVEEFVDEDEIDPEKLKVIFPTIPLDLQKALVVQLGV